MQCSRFLIPFGIKLTAVASDGRTIGGKSKKKDLVRASATPAHVAAEPWFRQWFMSLLYKNVGADV
jgi:hypothetical protein